MTKSSSLPDPERWADLRKRAEAVLDSGEAGSGPVAGIEARRLIQELRITQTELELQNEELRRTHHSLVQSRNRYETLFHAAPVGYIVVDRVGLVRHVNESFCQMLGRTTEHLLQRPLRSVVDESQRGTFDREFQALYRRRTPGVIETRLIHHEPGRRIDARLEGVMSSDVTDDGAEAESGNLLVAVSDITESKALAKQLWESQKLQTVGRLAGGIAHDFNNALTVIQNTIEVARWDLEKDHPLAQYLAQIETAATRSAALVQQLLAFAHKSVIVPRVLDPREFIPQMRAMLNRLLPESIQMSWTVSRDVHRIYADPSQVDQIITNLILNARDAITDQGAITVRCFNATPDDKLRAGFPEAAPGGHVAIEIRDDGEGMTEAVRQHIFEPFFTTKPQGKGTGLGLATVHGIVAQNRGIITVTSEPSRGSTFTVYLPRNRETSRPTGVIRRADDELRGNECLLLVEDDLQILTLTKRQLTRKGYRVEAFADPAQALAWFNEHAESVDAVISDVVMPGMSGPALVNRVLKKRPGLPVAFVTGYPETEAGGAGLDPARHLIIQKPFDSVTLLANLRKLLDDRPVD